VRTCVARGAGALPDGPAYSEDEEVRDAGETVLDISEVGAQACGDDLVDRAVLQAGQRQPEGAGGGPGSPHACARRPWIWRRVAIAAAVGGPNRGLIRRPRSHPGYAPRMPLCDRPINWTPPPRQGVALHP
jgi:hypothetical protein